MVDNFHIHSFVADNKLSPQQPHHLISSFENRNMLTIKHQNKS